MIIDIEKVVFFFNEDTNNNEKQACVFYTDGTSSIVSYERGKEIAAKMAVKNKMTSSELRNNNIIHFESSKKDLVKKHRYVAKKPVEEVEEKVFAKKEVKPKRKKKKSMKLKVAAATLAAVVGLSGTAFGLSKVSKDGVMSKSFFKNLKTSSKTTEELVDDNNDYYDSYTYEELLEVTNNKAQKAEMQRVHDALYGYNIDFAENYLEEGKDIRAALSFQEVVALSQAYNDFTPEEIKAIFNGKSITAAELDSSYKTATLQLMGAHVIENSEHPVDMSGLIVSEEGKAFYNKYHKLFLEAKEATGDDKIAKVEAFYNEVRKDFPIDPDTREIGISHSSSHQVVESYKLAITPMVAAGEIMWQNLDIDKTLQGGVNAFFFGDVNVNELSKEELVEIILNGNVGVAKGEIDYFNDLGLCNQAEDKFEIIQQITMNSVGNSDKTNPRYDQYENAMIKDLTNKDAYVIDDAHRELSELDRFQDEVNWHFELDEYGYYTGSVYYTTETHTRTRTWKKTKTTKKTVVTRTEKEITDDAKKEVDKETEKENKKAEEEGKKQATENQEKMQEEEDKKAEEIKEEVKKDEEDMQEKIDDANDKINENQKITEENEGKPADEQKPTDPVNESDFGDHNVVFDDEHKDDQGNLNPSVENITTDDTDVKTEADLPDPNETGKKFDEEGEKAAAKSEAKAEAPKTETKSEPKAEAPKAETKSEPKAEAPKSEPKSEPKAEAPKAEAPKAEPKKSNDQIVNDYVEEMANTSDKDESAKELTKN